MSRVRQPIMPGCSWRAARPATASARKRCSRKRVQSRSESDRVLCWPTSPALLGSAQRPKPSDGTDVLRFLALLAGRDVELDALSLVESSVSVTLDGREVHEDIVPPLDGDEPVALLCVEPLDRAGRCHALLRSLPFPTESASVSGCICKGRVARCESIRTGRYE